MSDLPDNVQNHMAAAQRIMQRCDTLAECSSMEDGICRVYLSDEHRQVNTIVADWMNKAGMTTYTDAAGSICGRFGPDADDAPVLLIGSHLDTIPNAGRYDGILGVMLAIELSELMQSADLPFAVEVIGFGEEEGVRFGTTLMTSRACAGTWDNSWLALQDEAETNLNEAMQSFGLDPARIDEAKRVNSQIIGFLEAHIEQGPVLETKHLPLAVVSSIAGARRLRLTLEGQAAHAGTMPMNMRQDALATASRIISLVEDTAVKHNIVATVGQIQCYPNAVNVVPGRVEFSIDARSGDDARRDVALAEILASAHTICNERGLTMTETPLHNAGAVACAPNLQQAVAHGIESTGLSVHHMESGAGHDAMAFADLCPVGMLFIRCTGGISHHPDEAVTVEDVSFSLTALNNTVRRLAETYTAQETHS
ncbi:MAG: allantoate amidohydrolase [Pseudomonadota bacterium]